MRNTILRRGRLALLALVLLLTFVAPSCSSPAEGDVSGLLVDLGIPLLEQYPNGEDYLIRARVAWDTIFFDGNLYVGCGDYDSNMGPVKVWHYDPDKGAWEASAEPLEDEHIKRFTVLDGTLTIPGTDPRGDWSQGSFYTLEGGAWVEHDVLPSGIHCFDAVSFEGAHFFALGVNSGDWPVVRSANGETYEPIPFLRDGAPVDTSCPVVRVHNFVVAGGDLYAFLTLGDEQAVTLDIYRYEQGAFRHHAAAPEVYLRSYDAAYTGEFAGLATFINGYCYYYSEDLVSFRPCRVEMSDLATDMTVIGDTLYALAYTKLEDGFESAVYASKDGKTFQKLFSFVDEIPAGSFAYGDGFFYFSMGRYYDGDSSEVGRVYALSYDLAP